MHLFLEVEITPGNGLLFIFSCFSWGRLCLLKAAGIWSLVLLRCRAHHHLTPLTPWSRMQHNLAEKSAGRGLIWVYYLLATLTLGYLPYLHSLWITLSNTVFLIGLLCALTEILYGKCLLPPVGRLHLSLYIVCRARHYYEALPCPFQRNELRSIWDLAPAYFSSLIHLLGSLSCTGCEGHVNHCISSQG